MKMVDEFPNIVGWKKNSTHVERSGAANIVDTSARRGKKRNRVGGWKPGGGGDFQFPHDSRAFVFVTGFDVSSPLVVSGR